MYKSTSFEKHTTVAAVEAAAAAAGAARVTFTIWDTTGELKRELGGNSIDSGHFSGRYWGHFLGQFWGQFLGCHSIWNFAV